VADVSGRTYRSSSASSVHPDRDGARVTGPGRQRNPNAGRYPAEPAPAPPRPRRKRKDPLWAKLLVIVGALLMMGSGGVIVGGKVLLSQATSNVNRRNLLGGAGVAQGSTTSIDGPINLLLVGLDARAKQSSDELVRSDTIVILHVPASHDQAYLVSIPRDARVKIPDYPKTNFTGWSTKINAAFAFGHQGAGTEEEKRARGVELLAMTIRDLVGIQFNGAAIIDFVGFEAVLAALGGVTICVDHRAESIHLAENKDGKLQRVWYDEKAGKVRDILPGYKPVTYQPGCQRLGPQKALDYSRIRKGLPNGDYDRQQHQQQLLKAMAKEATSKGMITDPAKALRVVQAAGKAFTLDTQGIPMEDFIFTLKGVAANDMILVKTNAGKVNPVPGTSDELLTEDSLQMLESVRDGKLLEFLAGHPEFVGKA